MLQQVEELQVVAQQQYLEEPEVEVEPQPVGEVLEAEAVSYTHLTLPTKA